MPIQPMYFQPLSFDQNNPFLTGIGKGQQMVGTALQDRQLSLANQLAQATLPYAAPKAEADLQSKQLANALDQNTLNYAPQMSQAELAIKQAQPGLIQAQTGETNAQTGLIGQQTKFYPLKALIEAQQANQSSNRFGQAYQLAKALQEMPAPTRAAWIAKNQEAYNQMVADIANGQKQQQSFITPAIMQQYFPGSAQPTPSQEAPTIQQVTQQMGSEPAPGYLMRTGQPPQAQPQVQQTGQPNLFSNPDKDLNEITKQASMMAANKSLTTAATQRQMEGAIQVENIVNDPRIQQQVVNASQYAGVMGRGKKAIDALSQTNPQAYEDYLSLKYQTMPLLENRIKTLDQMGATDSQREVLEGMFKKTSDALLSNSGQFVEQFNALTKTLDTVARSVQASATPLYDVNRLSGAMAINQPSQTSGGTATQNSPETTTVTVQALDGKKWKIPKDKLDAALKRGAKQI
jgi:hypothetical protein